ncbi:hypothetical protein F4814DRAFT_161522 [Daldinia grandis]|nr:hypothetical protein F4814DRAFT_161522 [Daldinia grandis]
MHAAVVTGANSGIGHASAQILIREGYHIIATDINADEKAHIAAVQQSTARRYIPGPPSPRSRHTAATTQLTYC